MTREIPMPKLHEGLMNQEWYKVEFDQQQRRAAGNPFINRYAHLGMREGIFSDMAAALGSIHDVVVEAAKPKLIGRQIIDTRTTTEALERYIKAAKSVAYVGTENGIVRLAGERYSTVDIQTNIVVKDGVEWSREFAEDAKWNVMNRQLEELGRSVAEKETALIVALYEAITAGNLAGGAEIAGSGAVMSWSKVAEMFDAAVCADWTPDVLFAHPKQLDQLLTATEFINNQYLPSGSLNNTGQFGQVLTTNMFGSTKCTNGKVHVVSKVPAGILLIRRDITTEPYEDPRAGKYGIVATERIGYGILRSDAVARGTNFKTTFS